MELKRSILIEGADGSGKSALFNLMTQQWRLPSAGHDGGPPIDALDVQDRLRAFISAHPAVRDRCPAISDIVYSKVLDRGTKYPRDKYERFLSDFNPFVVYCRPPLSVIMSATVQEKPHKTQEHVRAVVDKRLDIVTAYDRILPELLEACGLDGVIYDWTEDHDGRKLYAKLEDWACVD